MMSDDQGNDEAVVPTDAITEEYSAALARIAELEAENDELLADPYRPSSTDGQGNFDIPSVTLYEETTYRGDVAAWERQTGETYEEQV